MINEDSLPRFSLIGREDANFLLDGFGLSSMGNRAICLSSKGARSTFWQFVMRELCSSSMESFESFRRCQDTRTQQELHSATPSMSQTVVPSQQLFLRFVQVEI